MKKEMFRFAHLLCLTHTHTHREPETCARYLYCDGSLPPTSGHLSFWSKMRMMLMKRRKFTLERRRKQFYLQTVPTQGAAALDFRLSSSLQVYMFCTRWWALNSTFRNHHTASFHARLLDGCSVATQTHDKAKPCFHSGEIWTILLVSVLELKY